MFWDRSSLCRIINSLQLVCHVTMQYVLTFTKKPANLTGYFLLKNHGLNFESQKLRTRIRFSQFFTFWCFKFPWRTCSNFVEEWFFIYRFFFYVLPGFLSQDIEAVIPRARGPTTLLQRDSNTGAIYEICEIFKNTFFKRAPPVETSQDI